MAKVSLTAGRLVRRRWLQVAVGSAVLAASIVIPASPAMASASGDYTSTGVRIRSCPSTSCTAYGLGYPGQGATIYCYKLGTIVNGTPYWYYHRNKTTGVTGYSTDAYMSFVGSVSAC
jgi:hypothetical protein